jgi:predicted nucleic acid-binding protein
VTSFLIDANLLVYASMPAAREHLPARAWLAGVMSGPDEIAGLSWTTVYAFVRLVSNRRIVGDEVSRTGRRMGRCGWLPATTECCRRGARRGSRRHRR